MNRNTVIGLLLIGAIFIIWSVMMSPSEEERRQMAEDRRIQDSIRLATEKKIDSLAEIKAQKKAEELIRDKASEKTEQNESPVSKRKKTKYGDFGNAATAEDQIYYLETDLLKIQLSNRGGKIRSVELKDYLTYDTLPLILFNSDSSVFGFDFVNENRTINTNDLCFKAYFNGKEWSPGDTLQINGSDNQAVTFRLFPDNGTAYHENQYMEYIYNFRGDNYMLDFSVNLTGLQDIINPLYRALDLNWEVNLRQQEKSVDRFNAPTVYFCHLKDDVDYLSETSDDEENVQTTLKWVSFKQHFFASTLIAKDGFVDADMKVFTEENPRNPRYLKTMAARLGLPFERGLDQSYQLSFYFGPLKYKTLRKYKLDLEQQIPLGWSFRPLAWINQYAVIPVFDFLGRFGWNYGIIILVLTIMLKMVLFPIAMKTYKSSAKMRVLKPDIEEINKKFPKREDGMKKQQATMALYKKAGVNPLAGCVPMLLQMPILIAMFRFFPSSIELRQKSFLWATDLSSYDSIWTFPDGFSIPFYGDHVSLFTLLMTVSTIIYTRLNNQMMSSGQQMPGMKWMMYLMPVMFLGIFNNYASALSYYYFLANIITFAQMYLFRLTIDEKKLRLKIQEAKKRPVKKSAFQKRLEEAAKKRGYQNPKKK